MSQPTEKERIERAMRLILSARNQDDAFHCLNWVVQALKGECEQCGGTVLTGHQPLCPTDDGPVSGWFR